MQIILRKDFLIALIPQNEFKTKDSLELGLGTIATQAANSVAITGGSINGTTIGDTTASTGRFSDLTDTGLTAGRVTSVNIIVVQLL
jgi:hypothetical protein